MDTLPRELVDYIESFYDMDSRRIMRLPPRPLRMDRSISYCGNMTSSRTESNDDDDERIIVTSVALASIYELKVSHLEYYFNSMLCIESYLTVTQRGCIIHCQRCH